VCVCEMNCVCDGERDGCVCVCVCKVNRVYV
jgi:hypothetical protein